MEPTPLPTHVIKRDGTLRPFDLRKLASALARAGGASGEYTPAHAETLVDARVAPRVRALGPVTPHIEQLQDIVEGVLFDQGLRRTLRAYIVYREQHRQLRAARHGLVD